MNDTKIVFLPGLDGKGDYYEPLVKLLQPQYDCSVLPYPTAPMSFEALRGWVCGKLDAQTDYILIAESFGGPLAVAVASSFNGRIKAMVLCATFMGPPIPAYMLSLVERLYPQTIKHAGVVVPLLGWLMFNGRNPEMTQKVYQTLLETPQETMLDRLRQLARLNLTETAKRLTVPLLVLKPKQDWTLWLGKSGMPESWPITQMEGPHELLGTEPQAAFDVITDFIRKLN